MLENNVKPGYVRQYLKGFGTRNLMLIGVLTMLAITIPLFVFNFANRYFDYSTQQSHNLAAQARKDARTQRVEKNRQRTHDRLINPGSGTTPELVAALSIGMTGEEVQKTLNYPYTLGFEIFPYNHTYNGVDWMSNDIAIKGVGYVQAVFIESQLVGLGSLDPNDGRVCGGCLEDMLRGERPRLEGLPYHVNGKCPVCGSDKVVPYGVRWTKIDTQGNVCCDVAVPMRSDSKPVGYPD